MSVRHKGKSEDFVRAEGTMVVGEIVGQRGTVRPA